MYTPHTDLKTQHFDVLILVFEKHLCLECRTSAPHLLARRITHLGVCIWVFWIQ
jgi:hypothetical protein